MGYKVAIDAMGGDYAPQEIVKGVVQALKQEPQLDVVLIGDRDAILKELDKNNYNKPLDIVHTTEYITMDDSPKKALAAKPEASITVAMKLLDAGKADALVSAGNTGATVMACAKNLHMIEGLERSALAAVYPTSKFNKEDRGFALMMDVGATIHCTAKQLAHFAFMGSYYMSEIMGVERPKVGLLNNGEEETKGGPVMTKAYKYMKAEKEINFIGNIEGKEVPKAGVDVVITEGFVGNIVLKLLEGVGEVVKEMGKFAFKEKLTWKIGLAMLSNGIKRIKAKADYSEYGGAPILGFNRLVIKSHGRSNAKAIKNATLAAYRSVEHDIVGHMTESIKKFNEKHALDFMDI